jgi:hypothetical protein
VSGELAHDVHVVVGETEGWRFRRTAEPRQASARPCRHYIAAHKGAVREGATHGESGRRTNDSSVRALAVKSRAFGAPRCGFGT